eukprot:CAMPEP_0171671654 /NCGR_PEP_ID=MMETSP0990-20121206/51436_1 /TAXON_ID=483369 /ORGANISM="non described non described, Strain CCMP2098" /LENGTH=182 /DNA_ID=CAMNT_0012256621 /DNA_START=192 /DNA_END=737 /DNA_ORIENTATION=+
MDCPWQISFLTPRVRSAALLWAAASAAIVVALVTATAPTVVVAAAVIVTIPIAAVVVAIAAVVITAVVASAATAATAIVAPPSAIPAWFIAAAVVLTRVFGTATLSECDPQLSTLHDVSLHLVEGFVRVVLLGESDEGVALGVLRVVVTRNVHVTYLSVPAISRSSENMSSNNINIVAVVLW